MNQFEEIAQTIPKPVIQWDSNDVTSFLEIMGLNAIIPKFQSLAIDGKKLIKMDRQFVINQLKITSLTYMKKLVEWIQFGKQEYDEFLKTFLEQNHDKIKQKFHKDHYNDDVKFIQSCLVIAPRTEEKKVQVSTILVITIDQKEHIIKESSKIGRNPENQIVIPQESISRLHSEIVFQQNGIFVLKDHSTFGTFVKITKKIQLYYKLHISFGQAEAQVHKLKVNKNGYELTLHTPQNQKQKYHSFFNKPSISIGKKSKDFLISGNDMSNYHARIYQQDEKLILESLEGVCYRRLRQKQEYVIEDGDIFKMGVVLLKCQLLYSCDFCKKTLTFEKIDEHECDNI